LPRIEALSRVSIACRASVSSGISTNPKPLLLPVSLSITILAKFTVPYNSNISFRSTSSKSPGRPATKSFMPIDLRGKITKIKTIYSILSYNYFC
jgi:hypothetical protein